jgi:hypothetical protein
MIYVVCFDIGDDAIFGWQLPQAAAAACGHERQYTSWTVL